MPVTNAIVLEAKMEKALILKKVTEAIKDVLSDCSWDCTNTGMSLQAMDSAHVALVSVNLKADGFAEYHCNRNVTLGVSLGRLVRDSIFSSF